MKLTRTTLGEVGGFMYFGMTFKAKLSEEHERQMQKFAEERRLAEQAIEEERTRRLKLLQDRQKLKRMYPYPLVFELLRSRGCRANK